MQKNVRMVAAKARDAHSVFIPDVKNGDLTAADYVLRQLKVHTNDNWLSAADNGNNPAWGEAELQADGVVFSRQNIAAGTMPVVTGMGARDAIFLLEQLGLKVHISGTGEVKSQSIAAGTQLQPGMTCNLTLG